MTIRSIISSMFGVSAAFLIASCNLSDLRCIAKAITAYSFTNPVATGTIDENAKTIIVKVPEATNKKNLVAAFASTGIKVEVGSVIQTSGVTPNDFSNPILYTVTADNNSTTEYLVTVHNGAKAITAFRFTDPDETGDIDESRKRITLQVPAGTNLASLVANFTTTGANVRVGSSVQASGFTANDFSSPVSYTVYADDGTSVTYTVIVRPYKRCLFLSASADPVEPKDTVLVSKLRSWKYDVTVKASSGLGAWPADSFAGFDFAFLSESPNSSNYAPLRGHPLPLLNLEAWAADKTTVLNWGKGGTVGNYESKVCVVTGMSGHPLTAGFPNGKEFRLADSTSVPGEAAIAFEPAINVIPIASFKDSLSLVCACAVEKGTLLADGTTTVKNRAVTIGIHASAYGYISAEAYQLLRAGIRWILGDTTSVAAPK